MGTRTFQKDKPDTWTRLVGDEQWAVYDKAIKIAKENDIPFVLGGAFGIATYTGRWRNTKDLDFFVLPESKDKFIQALLDAGFEDYYPKLAYDRSWIFRFTLDGTIVDVIWTTPNHRTVVTKAWLEKSGWLNIRDYTLPVIPPEELISIKLYVLQRDRCDWPDVLNVINATGRELDWNRLAALMGNDLPLLSGVLTVYSWLNPGAYNELPPSAKELIKPAETKVNGNAAAFEQERVKLLDSRRWYSAFVAEDQLMEL